MDTKGWTHESQVTPKQRHPESSEIWTEKGGRSETNGRVTMATTSRYLSEQRYVRRKPLFPDQHHTSVPKTTCPHERSEKQEKSVFNGDGECPTLSGSYNFSHGEAGSRGRSSSVQNMCELQEQSASLSCATGWAPPRPWFTSTSTPSSRRSTGPPESRLEGWKVRSEGLNSSSLSFSEEHNESPYRERYWACAIPRDPPPAFDRRSSSWDPCRAYEALLDYTYPLRPGSGVSEGDLSGLQEASHLQDSGLGLDHLDSSASLTELPCSATGHRARKSLDLQSLRSSGDRHPPEPGTPFFSSLDKRVWSHDCSSSSTRLLPRSKCVCSEMEEEFWALPQHLEVLQQLSNQCVQVREATTKVSRESDELLLGSDHDSVEAAERQRHRCDGGKAWAELTAAQSLLEPLAGLQEPEAVGKKGSWETQDQDNSVMQHIQVFCSHLKLLLQQLYSLSERMQSLSTPSVDAHSVKWALAEYQSFQRAVSRQQPLSAGVLHSGQLLLSSINAASPVLSDTLHLIERQSGELQSHAQLFLSSILSVVDSAQHGTDDAAGMFQAH
ncbi:unnamed protein product [Ophioblennius macclurei]